MVMLFAAVMLRVVEALVMEGCEVFPLEVVKSLRVGHPSLRKKYHGEMFQSESPHQRGQYDSTNSQSTATMRCDSLEDLAAPHYLPPSAGGYSIVEAEIRCGGGDEGRRPNVSTAPRTASHYPNLTSLSIHECGPGLLAATFNSTTFSSLLEGFNHLLLLNLSGNRLEAAPWWQSFQSVVVDVLDLRGNQLSCEKCTNRWLADVYAPLPSVPPNPASAEWNVHSIFQNSLPLRALLDLDFIRSCASRFSRNCNRESVEFPLLPATRQTNTTLGMRLELKCRMRTARATPPASHSTQSPFYWPLSSMDDEASKVESLQSRVEWSGNTDATLVIGNLTSNHLGLVSCRCFHCDTPVFSTMELRFDVPPTIRVEDDVEGSAHLIVHGYPLSIVSIRITRLVDNTIESVESEDESDEWHMFNDTLLLKYLAGHSFYFLKYFSLHIHECSNCATWLRGDYRLSVCNTLGCAHTILRHLGHHQEHPKVPLRRDAPKRHSTQLVSTLYAFLGLLMISVFLLLLLLLISPSTWKKWRRKLWGQQGPADVELKRRRASRHTGSTEETAIPLEDTVSRSLSTSHYITQHVSVVEASELKVGERIGRGAFGEVFAAEWGSERVAVKMLQSGTQFDAEMDKEAAMLSRLFHPNVLQLHGITYCEGRVALVMELMALGELKSYLRERAPKCSNYSQFPPALLSTELLNISIQIAEGLNYLTSQSIVHRDLAARNCLVSGESDAKICSATLRPPITVKISDFGMSRRLYSDAVYYRVKSKSTALPVRWLPGDCLSSGRFTHQSDVWAFGVTLYEIFTYGSMPFGNLSNDEVCAAVLNGMRPDVPASCPAEVRAVMAACWRELPNERIPIEHALERLKSTCRLTFSDWCTPPANFTLIPESPAMSSS